MPNYNGEKYISKAINCFLSQEYLNKELVVVDGKSTDKSHEIIQSFVEKNKNIIWLKYPDKGISNAFNFALEKVSGEIIGYSGSDDLLSPDILTTINNYANKIDFDVIYFDSYTYLVDENKKILRKCPSIKFNKKNLLRYGTIVGLQDIFFKKYIYDKHKLDEKNKFSMDYEFYLRISKENYKYFYTSEIATTNIFDNNISSDKDGVQKEETYGVFKKYANLYEKLYRLRIEKQGALSKILKNYQKLLPKWLTFKNL